jgi:hypothetical protein
VLVIGLYELVHAPGELPGDQGLTLVHVRAQLERLQDTFMGEAGLHGGQNNSS